MTFLYPEALLLAPIVVLIILARKGKVAFKIWRRPRTLLRAIILAALIAAMAGPSLITTREGVDLIFVIDRSLSMPAASFDAIEETIKLAEAQRGEDDRIGIVTFGMESRVERLPSTRAEFTTFQRNVEPDSSDLAGAIQVALDMIDDAAAGKLVIISDGEYTGTDPTQEAWRAAARGVPIDFRHILRPSLADAAVEDLQLPLQVQPGESFSFAGIIAATGALEVGFTLRRNGVKITTGTTSLRIGRNRLLFRDRPTEGGIAEYSLSINSHSDRMPENNVGRGVTRVEARGAILLVTHDGRGGNLGRALATTGRTIDVVHVKDARFDLDSLSPYRLVVFENVAAREINWNDQEGLVRYVRDTGGGFLLTGGRRSFGVGGYHRSKLEVLLPVSLELRSEQRKLSVAMAFVLDRSGSMAAATSSGQTKMQLANSGCLAAVDTLSRYDQVAVIAVDSSSHVIVPLTNLNNVTPIKTKISQIGAGGGGIYTYTGLLAGGNQVSKANASGRRIVLFADAADAEEPGKYIDLLTEYGNVGITVSVIALGTESDSDAEFLKDVAHRGGGEIYFTESPEQLPQLFAMEAISLTKAGFVDVITPCTVLPDLSQLGFEELDSFPDVGGYNLTNAKPNATVGVVSHDDNKAPILAYRHIGLGRTAVLTAEADGNWSGPLASWNNYASFFATLADRLMGTTDKTSYSARATRDGRHVTVTLELDPDDPDALPATLPTLKAIPSSPTDTPIERTLTWQDEHTLVARYKLKTTETWHHVVTVEGEPLIVNPVTLPYSPEFAPRSLLATGQDILQDMASATGGQERVSMARVFEGAKIGAASFHWSGCLPRLHCF